MYSKLSYKQAFLSAFCFIGTSFLCGVQANEETGANPELTCANASAYMNILVQNIRTDEGNLRAQVYSSNPDDFLAKGKKIVRVDVPVEAAGEQEICVPFPEPGTYAVVVMHDRNANGKADFFSEGFGFSNNPKLLLAPPDAEDVMIKVPEGANKTSVKLKYIIGADEQQDKRRKLKRR